MEFLISLRGLLSTLCTVTDFDSLTYQLGNRVNLAKKHRAWHNEIGTILSATDEPWNMKTYEDNKHLSSEIPQRDKNLLAHVRPKRLFSA